MVFCVCSASEKVLFLFWKFFLKSWRGSRLACRLASAGSAWLLAGRAAGPLGWLFGRRCASLAALLWCSRAFFLAFDLRWRCCCGAACAAFGCAFPRAWVAGSRLRFVFCVIGFAGFLCGFRFRSFAFMPSRNAVSGRFWVRALSNLCRRLAAADFSLCAPRFCACVRVLRLRALSDFCRFEKLFSVAWRVGSNFFLVFGPCWRGARRAFEKIRMGLQAPPCAARVPCCCRAAVVLLCVVVCWCVCGGWCGFV